MNASEVGMGVIGMALLNRTDPSNAARLPSQCCSQSAANLRMSLFDPYTTSRTVNWPVKLLQLRPSPHTSSPGWPAEARRAFSLQIGSRLKRSSAGGACELEGPVVTGIGTGVVN